ncbi:MAG: hypothetical protein GTN36_05420 [Candidatus Aenigmarchaeota archaeon]|nr:hypothetical protein [Candidatus Aenigmarchaeota archaeon]
MIKIRILHNPHQEYCKYRDETMRRFFEFIDVNKLKTKMYKNGNMDIWFNKSAYKYGSYLINNLEFESVALELKKLK